MGSWPLARPRRGPAGAAVSGNLGTAVRRGRSAVTMQSSDQELERARSVAHLLQDRVAAMPGPGGVPAPGARAGRNGALGVDDLGRGRSPGRRAGRGPALARAAAAGPGRAAGHHPAGLDPGRPGHQLRRRRHHRDLPVLAAGGGPAHRRPTPARCSPSSRTAPSWSCCAGWTCPSCGPWSPWTTPARPATTDRELSLDAAGRARPRAPGDRPGRGAPVGGRGRPGDAGHAHLHLRHHRPAEGRPAGARQLGVRGGRGRPARADRRRRRAVHVAAAVPLAGQDAASPRSCRSASPPRWTAGSTRSSTTCRWSGRR